MSHLHLHLPRRPRLRLMKVVALGLALAVLAPACSLRTAGSPKGDLELTATFEDVSNLVVGHSVKLADVTIGTVTHVTLDGYRAQVTMSIEDGHPIPADTTAVLAKTSLLGEQYIELRLPANLSPADADESALLHTGDAITRTTSEAEFEEVTERAIEFLGAITANDLTTIVSTGASAFGGRGTELNELLADLTTVVSDLDSQREQIASTIDGFGQLTRDLAANDDRVAGLVDDLAGASVTLAANRDRMVAALSGIRDLSEVSTNTVLVPHLDDLISTLHDLDPIVATLAGQRPLIESLLESVNDFLVKISNNVAAEDTGAAAQAQYIWARGLATPSGAIGDAPPPVDPADPALPVGPTVPSNSADVVTGLVGSILGLLGTLPDITLPPAVCDRLTALQAVVDGTLAADLQTQMATLCPAGGQGGQPTQPGQPPVTVPVPLPGTGGSGGTGGGSGNTPLSIPGLGG